MNLPPRRVTRQHVIDVLAAELTEQRAVEQATPRSDVPAGLRDAIVAAIDRHEVVWVDHDTGWECGCNEHGDGPLMPTRADAVNHIADAVLSVVQAHVAAEVERARAAGAAEALRGMRAWAEERAKAWETPFPNDWDATHLHVRSGCQSALREVLKELDRAAGGEQRG